MATTDHDAADAIESVPGAFGGTTLSLLLSEKRALRMYRWTDNAEPPRHERQILPYAKTFYMVTNKNPPVSVRRSSISCLSRGSGDPRDERPGCGGAGGILHEGTRRNIPGASRDSEGFCC